MIEEANAAESEEFLMKYQDRIKDFGYVTYQLKEEMGYNTAKTSIMSRSLTDEYKCRI